MKRPWVREDETTDERQERREQAIARLGKLVSAMEASVKKLQVLADDQVKRMESHGG